MRVLMVPVVAVAAHLALGGVGPAAAQAGGGMHDFSLRVHGEGPLAQPYRLYVPAHGPTGLLVMLHGCTQSAADLAAGSGMNRIAEEGGFAVLYPEQPASAHPQTCWTWYDRSQQRADGAEVLRLAGLVEAVRTRLGLPTEAVHAAGLSAGGAMAGILAAVRPGIFTSLAVVAGVAVGAAQDVNGALAALQQGAPNGAPPLPQAGREAPPERVLVVHGADDAVVRPVNGVQVTDQWRGPLEARAQGRDVALEGPAGWEFEEGGRLVRVREWTAQGEVVLRHLEVAGLAHAWSGGAQGIAHTDPAGPSASRHIARFFRLVP